MDSKRFTGPHTIVGIGEALWDLLPAGRHIGGAPLNFAYISSLLGERGIAITRVGDDELGHELKRELSQRGVDPSYVQRDAILPTGQVSVIISENGQPSYEIPHPSAWDALQWTPELKRLAQAADAVCFGTLGQRSAESRSTIRTFLQETRADCTRIFDINLRAPFYSPDLIRESLALSTIAKLNEAEFIEVSRMFGLPEAANVDSLQAFARRFDLRVLCITRGAQGSLIATPNCVVEHPGFVTEVRDTIGSGDAFAAAVAHQWIRGSSLETMSAVANKWASWVASQVGGMPPLMRKPS